MMARMVRRASDRLEIRRSKGQPGAAALASTYMLLEDRSAALGWRRRHTGLTLISGRFPFPPLFAILDHHHVLYCNYVFSKAFMPRSRSVDIVLYANMMVLRND